MEKDKKRFLIYPGKNVIVRDYTNRGLWKLDVFSHICRKGFQCVGGIYGVISVPDISYLGKGEKNPDEISFQDLDKYDLSKTPVEGKNE